MDPLPPIPTPPAQRWREFRIQVLPLIVFVIVVTVVAFLWSNFVQPAGVIGEVEAIKANVTSLEDGLLTEMRVGLLEPVKAGDVVGYVQIKSPAAIRAELAALEGELRITGIRAAIDERGRAQDLEQFKLDLMDQRTELAGDQKQLVQASNNFFRVQKVYLEQDGVYSPDDFDRAEADYRTLEALVEHRTELLEVLGEAFDRLAAGGPIDVQAAIDSAISSHREELERSNEPIALVAPIDGTISAVFRRTGERVLGGEPLLTISAQQASRIVGYVRQPIATMPAINDSVVITTRHQPRRKAEGQILQVGSQIELVRPGVLSQDNTRIDTGLPILISLPPGLEVLPGELVDLAIRYAKN